MFESLLIIAIILSFLSIPCNVPDGAVYMSFSMPKKYTYYVRGQGNAHHGGAPWIWCGLFVFK